VAAWATKRNCRAGGEMSPAPMNRMAGIDRALPAPARRPPGSRRDCPGKPLARIDAFGSIHLADNGSAQALPLVVPALLPVVEHPGGVPGQSACLGWLRLAPGQTHEAIGVQRAA
jgi:hypothetical protein